MPTAPEPDQRDLRDTIWPADFDLRSTILAGKRKATCAFVRSAEKAAESESEGGDIDLQDGCKPIDLPDGCKSDAHVRDFDNFEGGDGGGGGGSSGHNRPRLSSATPWQRTTAPAGGSGNYGRQRSTSPYDWGWVAAAQAGATATLKEPC